MYVVLELPDKLPLMLRKKSRKEKSEKYEKSEKSEK